MVNDYREFLKVLPFPCLVLKVSEEGLIIENSNQELETLTGKKNKEIRGLTISMAFSENPKLKGEGCDLLQYNLEKVLKTNAKVHIECMRYDLIEDTSEKHIEKYWEVKMVPLMNADSNVEFILITLFDKTEEILDKQLLKQFELELQKTNRESTYLIQQNPSGLYFLDLEGNFISVNKSLSEIAETPEKELLEMSFLPFCAPSDKDFIVQQFQDAIGGNNRKFEANFITGKGRPMVLDVYLIPMKLDGKIHGAYGIAQDVTSIKKAEKLILEKKKFSKANTAISKLLSNHDLQTLIFKKILKIVTNVLDTSRIYYVGKRFKKDSPDILLNESLEVYGKDNMGSKVDQSASNLLDILNHSKETKLMTFSLSKLPEGELKEFFKSRNTLSSIILPIFINKEFFGFIGVEEGKVERIWTKYEKEFLESLSRNFSSFVEKRIAEISLGIKEKELKKNQDKFKALIQKGSDLVGILDLEGNYKFVSENVTSILGLCPEDYVGKNAFDFIHPDDKNRVIDDFNKLGEHKQIRISAFRFAGIDKNWKWLETVATNLCNDPNVEGIVTNSKDVTTLIERTANIKELNERYKLIATATDDLIYDWDLKTDKVLRFFDDKKIIFGYNYEEIERRDFWKEHIHPNEINGLKKILIESLRDPKKLKIRTSYRFLQADGSFAHIIDRAHILRDNKGNAIRLIGGTRNVSDIIEGKEALKDSNLRLRYAMRASREMIWDWDIVKNVVKRSRAFKEIYGIYKEKEIDVENFWFSKIHHKDRKRVIESLQSALLDINQKKWKYEYRFIRSDGEKSHVIDRGFIIRDKVGKATRMIGAVLDVTESRDLLKDVKKQNKILKEVAWEQAHIVRAPVARLKGLLVLLEENSFEEWSREDLFKLIHDSANQVDEIITKIIKKTEDIEINATDGRKY